MILFLSGKISGDPNYKAKFDAAADELTAQGHIVLNPTILPPDLPYEKLMELCFAMIDVAEGVFRLADWRDSHGARRELSYAKAKQKTIGGAQK